MSNVLYAKSTPGGRGTLLAALLAAAVLLPLLGHRPLADWDEGIYAEIAREMLATHTLLAPHWNGLPWFEKPPLLMWLQAASLHLFGLNAFAARLPSTLAAIALVALLHSWLERRVETLTAWLSTVILLSAFGFQHAARAGETDTLLSLFCLLAILGLAELLADHTHGWPLFWTGFALALMTKGAASLVLPLTALTLIALKPRQALRQPRAFTLGLVLFLAIAVPWHAYMLAHFGQPFLNDYLGIHVLHRAAGAIEGHRTRWWFYVWVLLVSAPPFALLYPPALAAPFRRNAHRSPNPVLSTAGRSPVWKAASSSAGNEFLRTAQQPHPLLPFALFALVVLLLFTVARTRLPHYIAPAYPALSALTAALIAGWLHPLHRPKALRLAAAAIALYVLAALVTAKPRKALHSPKLPNGLTTPDNRESVALLQQLNHNPNLPPGPLLVWRQGPVVPITTDAFYSHRLAQQVTLNPTLTNIDPYTDNPKPLSAALGNGPRLTLLDRTLATQLPPRYTLQVLAQGSTQIVAILTPSR